MDLSQTPVLLPHPSLSPPSISPSSYIYLPLYLSVPTFLSLPFSRSLSPCSLIDRWHVRTSVYLPPINVSLSPSLSACLSSISLLISCGCVLCLTFTLILLNSVIQIWLYSHKGFNRAVTIDGYIVCTLRLASLGAYCTAGEGRPWVRGLLSDQLESWGLWLLVPNLCKIASLRSAAHAIFNQFLWD